MLAALGKTVDCERRLAAGPGAISAAMVSREARTTIAHVHRESASAALLRRPLMLTLRPAGSLRRGFFLRSKKLRERFVSNDGDDTHVGRCDAPPDGNGRKRR